MGTVGERTGECRGRAEEVCGGEEGGVEEEEGGGGESGE